MAYRLDQFVGVDIGGTKMLLCAEHRGEKIDHRVPTGRDMTRERVRAAIEAFLSTLPFEPLGVGVAVQGLVEGDARLAFTDGMPALIGLSADELAFGAPRGARLINDVRAGLVAESVSHPEVHTLCVVMMGTGVAVGIRSGGQILEGASGWAGELGNTLIATEEGVGTVDQLAGGGAILKRAGCGADELIARIEAGDTTATAIVQRAAFYFGLSLANVIDLFNPDLMVLGGGTLRFPGYRARALEVTEQYALAKPFSLCAFAEPADAYRMAAHGARAFAAQGAGS